MAGRSQIWHTILGLAALATAGVTVEAAASEPTPAAAGAAICRAAEVGLQVLGSGGPIAEGSRAGTSYAVWIDGRARLLVDAGPGSFIRFGEAGLKVSDLKAIALSHFHGDHSAGLAGILNSGSFEASQEPLVFIGPAAAAPFPGAAGFITAQFDGEGGAWSYLGGYLTGADGRRVLVIREVDAGDPVRAPTWRIALGDALSVTAIPVDHGLIPTLAYRIEAKGRTIVLAADQSAMSTGFDRETAGLAPDLLVAHHVIPEGEGQPIGLHRPPHGIGAMAANIAPRQLVLSHNMNRSLGRLEEGLAQIAARWSGPVTVADDGQCFVI